MKTQNEATVAVFLAGFFAKEIIDNIGFLITDNYPLENFGLTLTAAKSSHSHPTYYEALKVACMAARTGTIHF